MYEGMRHFPVILDTVLAAEDVVNAYEAGNVIKIDPFFGCLVEVEATFVTVPTDDLDIKIVKSLDDDGSSIQPIAQVAVEQSIVKGADGVFIAFIDVTGCVSFQVAVSADGATDTIVVTVRYRKYKRLRTA